MLVGLRRSLVSIAVTGAIISGVLGGMVNAVGAKSPGEFVGRFAIGFVANSVATLIAFLVANPVLQGVISSVLSRLLTLLWQSRRNPSILEFRNLIPELLIAASIGAIAGSLGERLRKSLLSHPTRDLLINVWKARTVATFTKNVRNAVLSGAVGGTITQIGVDNIPALRHTRNQIAKMIYLFLRIRIGPPGGPFPPIYATPSGN